MSVVKEGYVKRHSKNMFSGGWKDVYLKLYSDSNLLAYKKQGDREAKVQICMKNVCKHFAFGDHAAKNFKEMPQLPIGASQSCILAVPEKPSHKAKPHFFLMDNEQQLHEWMSAICSTLPPKMSQAPIQSQYVSAPPTAYSAPMGSPPMPQPVGFGNMAPAGYQAPYPAQPMGAYPQQQAPGYPQQQAPGYQQQPGYAPQPRYQQPYQQQTYPTQPTGYPQQQYYGQQPPGYQQPPPAGYAPAGYAQPQGQQVVYVEDHHKKKGGFPGGNTGKMAAGLLGGAALGYGASRMMGGGMGMGGMGMMGGFGPFGMGRCGSWSSMSSFGSSGSFGSFGSFD